jgi:hypothetical protein
VRPFAQNDPLLRVFQNIEMPTDRIAARTGHGSHFLLCKALAYGAAGTGTDTKDATGTGDATSGGTEDAAGRVHSAGATAEPSAASGSAVEASRHTRCMLAS